MDLTAVRGRWACARPARLFIDEVVATVAIIYATAAQHRPFFFCAVSNSEALGAQPNAFYVAVMICSSVTASVTSSLRQLPFRLRRFVLVPRLATSWKAAHPKDSVLPVH